MSRVSNQSSNQLRCLHYLCICQFLLILYLLNDKFRNHHVALINELIVTGGHGTDIQRDMVISGNIPNPTVSISVSKINSIIPNQQYSADFEKANLNVMKTVNDTIEGVAVTLMLHSPKWYQRRYTLMIQNTVNNLPNNWKIQIFYTGKGQSQAGLDINPGINRFIRRGDVVLTLLPKALEKAKRYQLMVNRWFWSHIIANRVLIFGGGSVVCSNSLYSINDFVEFDYIGAPWNFYQGRGGDGGISIRSRDHMIQAMDYAVEGIEDPTDISEAYKSWGQEDHFFVSTLLKMTKENRIQSHIASKMDTYKFAAIGSYVNDTVLIASGTLAEADFKSRDTFLQYCPELKMIYPSLHDPSCFGASSQINAEVCATTICALKPQESRKGGC